MVATTQSKSTSKEKPGPSTASGQTAPPSPFEQVAEQSKARSEVSKADLTQAKAEEAQVKTALIKRQAVDAGVPFGPPAPLAVAMDPITQQLQSLQQQLNAPGMSPEQMKTLQATFQSQDSPSARMAAALGEFVTERIDKVGSLEEKISSLKADTPNFGERLLQGVTLGLYDPTNDDQIKILEKEKNAITGSIFGIAQSTVSADLASRRRSGTEAFKAMLGEVKGKQDFAKQLQLFGLQQASKLQSERVDQKQKFELEGRRENFKLKLAKIEHEAKIELAEGKPETGEAQARKLNYGQGNTSYLRAISTDVPSFAGVSGRVYNATHSAVKTALAKSEFNPSLVASDVLDQSSSPEIVLRSVKEVRGQLQATFNKHLARESERIGKTATTLPFFTEGLEASHSQAMLMLDVIEQAAQERGAQVRGPRGLLTSPMTEQGMVEAYLDQRGLMVIPGDAAGSAEVIATGKFPNGVEMTDATAIRKAMEDGVWKSPKDLRRVASERISKQQERLQGKVATKIDNTVNAAFIESEMLKKVRSAYASYGASGGKPGSDISRMGAVQFGLRDRGARRGNAVDFRKALGKDFMELITWDPADVLAEIKKGTANKKPSDFSVMDRIFSDAHKLAPVLRRLGWTDLEAFKKKVK
tara:strand:+ start:6403 stop:8331 length:1929 start_codon:yes stop_codon:yes gene_type:complete